jgi:hypothetical protein
MRLTSTVLVSVFLFPLVFSACKKVDETTAVDISEGAQQVGDAMASVDESGGSTGTFAMMKSEARTFARLAPGQIFPSPLFSKILSSAEATACSMANTFGTCASNVMTRTFGSCTVGSATFSGTVTLTFNDGNVNATCTMDSNGDDIQRDPNFTISGRRDGTFTVSKTGTYGQKITRLTSSTYTFENDGIRRVLAVSGTTLYDFTTTTTSAIGITGTNRSGRVMSGGSLRVTNNLSSGTCDYVPSALTWGSTCNCPTSGSWTGTCSDGKTTSLTITGCGTGTYTLNSESESFTMDRCYSL